MAETHLKFSARLRELGRELKTTRLWDLNAPPVDSDFFTARVYCSQEQRGHTE